MICPQCKKQIADDCQFCEMCGHKIEDAREAESPDDSSAKTVERPVFSPQSTVVPELFPSSNGKPFTTRTFMDNGADCEPESNSSASKFDIEIEYAVNRYALAGGIVYFELRVSRRHGSLQDVRAWQEIKLPSGRVINTIEHDLDLNDDGGFNFTIPYEAPEGKGGSLNVDYYVMCRSADGLRFFHFNYLHPIVLLNGKNSTYVFQGGDGGLVIDCNGHTLNIPANVDPVSEIQRINNEPPKYETMSFKETKWRPEDFWCAKGARIPCDALTMKYDDMMIHLCSRNTIRVGRRSSKNDIAINDWRDKEHFDGLPSRTVSQCHGLFSYRRDGVVYEDCSRFGSEISVGESKMLLHRTESIIGKDKPYKVRLSRSGGKLSFGGISMDFKIHQCRWCSDSRYFCDCPDDSPCQSCSGNRCKALSLHRTDGLPEAFLFVWQCCDLGVVQPELAGYTVYRRNGMFLLETPDHKLMYLCPDDQMSIPVGDDKRLQLGPLSQPKFK